MIWRSLAGAAVVSLWTTAVVAQNAVLWSYTGDDAGARGFRIRKFAMTPDATLAVTFAQQFGTNSPQKAKFAV